MSWLSFLMLVFVAFVTWEICAGLKNGSMTPIAPTGGYLTARRATNPAGFWVATAFNFMILSVGLLLVFLP